MFNRAPSLYPKQPITHALRRQNANRNLRSSAPYPNWSDDHGPIRHKNHYTDSFRGQNHERGFADRSDNSKYYSASDTTVRKRPLNDWNHWARNGGRLQGTDNDNLSYQCIDYGHRKLSSLKYDGGTDQPSPEEYNSESRDENLNSIRMSDEEFFQLFEDGLDLMIRTDNGVQAILDSNTRLDQILSPLFRYQDFDAVTQVLGQGEETVAAKKLQKMVSLTKKKIQYLCSKIMKNVSAGQKDTVERTKYTKPEKWLSHQKVDSKKHSKFGRSPLRSHQDDDDHHKIISEDLRKSPDVCPQTPLDQPELSSPVGPIPPYPLLLPCVFQSPYPPNSLPDVSQPSYSPDSPPDVSQPSYSPDLPPDVSQPSYSPDLPPDVSQPSYSPDLPPDVSQPSYSPDLPSDVSQPSYSPNLPPKVSQPPYPPNLVPNVCQTQFPLTLEPMPPAGMFPGSLVPVSPMSVADSSPIQQPQVTPATPHKKKPRTRPPCLRKIQLISLKKTENSANIPADSETKKELSTKTEDNVVLKKNKIEDSVASKKNKGNNNVVMKKNNKKVKKRKKKDLNQMSPREKLFYLVDNLKGFKEPLDKIEFFDELFERIGRSALNVDYKVTEQAGSMFGTLTIDGLFITRRKASNKEHLKKIVHERAYNVLKLFPVDVIISLGDPSANDQETLKEERFKLIIQIKRIKNIITSQSRGKNSTHFWLHKVCNSFSKPLPLKRVNETVKGPDSCPHSMVKVMLDDCTLAVGLAPSLESASEEAYDSAMQRFEKLSVKEIAYEEGLEVISENSAEKESKKHSPLSVEGKFEKIKELLKKQDRYRTKIMKENYLNKIAAKLKIPHSLVYRKTCKNDAKVVCNLFLGGTFVACSQKSSVVEARASVYVCAWNILSNKSFEFIKSQHSGGISKSKKKIPCVDSLNASEGVTNQISKENKSESVSENVNNQISKENKTEQH